ncbi:MAG: LysM peptidoglycan-binding domain-containing protein [Epsilonproteobacteria bacterium]|nr:LysM peptidoglycan-binding domain-containing protein [Campylobacterota bacterium]
MLNKDQYNQDEYNDYYAQATQGAEIKGGASGGGSKKIILILLLLLLIGALGYFLMTTMGSSDTSNDTAKKAETSVSEQTTAPETATQDTVNKEVTKQVQNIASESGAMTPEQIAQIVQAVIAQQNKEKEKSIDSTQPNEVKTQDSSLEASLSSAEVDMLSMGETGSEVTISDSDSQKQASTAETVNTYNKVVVDQSAGAATDELSKLSDQISSAIDADDTPSNDSSYTTSITQEVQTRTKEMRYVTVRKGDTLGKIAQRVYGNVMDYKRIYDANPDILRRPDRIYIGQRLRVPE